MNKPVHGRVLGYLNDSPLLMPMYPYPFHYHSRTLFNTPIIYPGGVQIMSYMPVLPATKITVEEPPTEEPTEEPPTEEPTEESRGEDWIVIGGDTPFKRNTYQDKNVSTKDLLFDQSETTN